jgi:hypothetical protein
MTAGPGSEIPLARSQEWNFGFAQRKQAYRYRRLALKLLFSAPDQIWDFRQIGDLD